MSEGQSEQMKKIFYILILTLVFACNSEYASDCFQSSGSIIQQEITVDAFSKSAEEKITAAGGKVTHR